MQIRRGRIIALILGILIGLLLPQSQVSQIGNRILTVGTVEAAVPVDYVCDGVDDQVQVQAALDALPTVGGRIIILSGNYVFASTVSRAIDNVIIEGVGDGTYFANNGVVALFSAGARDGWEFRDFRTDAGGVTLTSATTYTLQNVTIEATYYAYSTDTDISAVSWDIPTGPTATYTITIAAIDAPALCQTQADVVCDGVDDHIQILAAFAAGHEHIYLTQGNFYGEDIDFASYAINLEGAGVFATYYNLEAGTDDYAFKTTSANYHSTIKNLSIACNGTNQTSGGGIKLDNFMATIIENIRIADAKQYGLYSTGSTEYVTLKNVVTYNCGYGFFLTGIQWYDLLQCNATQNNVALSSGILISGVDVLLIGCVADMATVGVDIAAGFLFYNSSRITALHCRSFGDPAASKLLRGFHVYTDAGASKAIRLSDCEAHNVTESVVPAFYLQTAAAGTLEASIFDCIHTGTGEPGFGDASSIAASITAVIGRNTSAATTPFSFANAGIKFQDNLGYIGAGEVKTATGTLTAGNTNAIAFAWHDPELQDILIKKVVIEITGNGTVIGGSKLDVGLADDAAGTNRGTEFFNDISLNAEQINDSWVVGDGGTQTKYVLCEDNVSATDGWIVGQILVANAAGLVGRYYIEYVGR